MHKIVYVIAGLLLLTWIGFNTNTPQYEAKKEEVKIGKVVVKEGKIVVEEIDPPAPLKGRTIESASAIPTGSFDSCKFDRFPSEVHGFTIHPNYSEIEISHVIDQSNFFIGRVKAVFSKDGNKEILHFDFICYDQVMTRTVYKLMKEELL